VSTRPGLSGRVLVTGRSVGERFMQQLSSAGLDVVNPRGSFPPSVLSESELRTELSSCVACLLGGDDVVTAAALEASPDLRVVAYLGIGSESFVDAAAAKRRGVSVTTTPRAMANSVAEFTVALVLNARRRIADSAAANSSLAFELRSDIADHPVGVVGLGATGTRICEILTLGFRADVRYFSRTRKEFQEKRLGIQYSSLADLMRTTEVLILMVPETPETAAMINRELLALRPPDSGLILIDTSRPRLVDPEALGWALDSRRVESVWFDGFYREESALIRALASRPEVHITPHIAWLTREACDAMAEMAVDSILNVLRDGSDQHIVNK
jgi:glyoxylate reductase